MIWVMTYNAKIYLIKNNTSTSVEKFFTNKNIIIPILIFCFFAAIRWDVGSDCRSYIFGFYRESEPIYLNNKEYAFYIIQEFFRYIALTHIPFFFIIALLQIGFMYYALKKQAYILLFLPLALFLSGTYWSFMGGVRQNIACCIFVYVTLLLSENRWKLALLWIIIASLFHKSAIVLSPIILIVYLRKIYIPNIYIQYGMLATCFIMMGANVSERVSEIIVNTIDFIGYEENKQSRLINAIFNITFGIRSYLLLIANCIVILYSNKLRKFYNSRHYDIMYILYYIGICINLLFYGNHGIERITMYLAIFIPIILGSLIFYLFYNRNLKSSKLCLFILILALLLRTLYDLYSATTAPTDVINYQTIFFQNINFF